MNQQLNNSTQQLNNSTMATLTATALTPEQRMEDITRALKGVCMNPREDSWHQRQYVDHGVGNLEAVVDKMCQLDWLHKYKFKEYDAEIKLRVEQIALERGGNGRVNGNGKVQKQYYKGIYVDAATDVQRLPKFQLKVNRGLGWMDEFKQQPNIGVTVAAV